MRMVRISIIMYLIAYQLSIKASFELEFANDWQKYPSSYESPSAWFVKLEMSFLDFYGLFAEFVLKI